MKHSALKHGVCFFIAVLALPGWAEEAKPVESEIVEFVEISTDALPGSNSVATKLETPLQRTPANVGVVGEAMIYEQDATVLGDVLENVSGLNIQNGAGVHDYFVIRGFNSIDGGLLMSDGVAEPEAGFYHTYNLTGVEVYKGPTGHLYGKNPLGGTVNLVRKQPLNGNFTVFNGSVGSFGTEEATVDWNLSPGEGQVNLRVNALWMESDGYRDDKESRQAAINPSMTVNFSETSRLNFNFEYVDSEFSPDNGIPVVFGPTMPPISRRRSFQPTTDFSEQEQTKFQLDYENRISDRVTIRNKAYYRDLDWLSDGALIFGGFPAPGPSVIVAREQGSLDDDQKFFGNQFEAIFHFETGTVEHRLLTGLEIRREEDTFTFGLTPLEDIELFSNTLVPVGGGEFPLNSAGDSTVDIIAPSVIDQIKFSEQFELTVGLRYDDIDTEASITPLGFPLPIDFDRDDSELSTMLGLLAAQSPTLSFYANAGQSYSPTGTRLVDEFDPASREPERATQFEVGVKKQFLEGRVRTVVSGYRIKRDHVAVTDPNGVTQQSSDQESTGFEFELAAESQSGLKTFLSYAYNESEFTDFAPCVQVGLPMCVPMDYTGNDLFMAPKNIANLWVSKSFGRIGLSGGARFVDEQYLDSDNAFTLDSAVLLNAAVFYDTDDWRFKINLKNLTDEEYATRTIAGGGSYVPADGFAAMASLEFRLR